MTADAGLASDSSETDFRLAAVLGSSSGSSCVYLCLCVSIYIRRSRYTTGERLDDVLANNSHILYTVNHRRVRLAGKRT